jgi:hypothetical protein
MLAQRLAALYQGAASVPTSREIASLRRWIDGEFSRITAPVIYVPLDLDLPDAVAHLRDHGVLIISTAHNDDHPILTPAENARFRAVHDWHHIRHGLDSSLSGEIAAYKVARRSAPRHIWWLLHSEIVLQAAAALATGAFQAQRTVNTIGR